MSAPRCQVSLSKCGVWSSRPTLFDISCGTQHRCKAGWKRHISLTASVTAWEPWRPCVYQTRTWQVPSFIMAKYCFLTLDSNFLKQPPDPIQHQLHHLLNFLVVQLKGHCQNKKPRSGAALDALQTARSSDVRPASAKSISRCSCSSLANFLSCHECGTCAPYNCPID